MIQIRGLHKYYHTKAEMIHSLNDVNLEFGRNGFVVILGRSGSGKSTLLNIIGGLDSYDKGEILIGNRSTRDFKSSDWDAFRNTFVGFVFQEYYVIDEYMVETNIALALKLQGYYWLDIQQKVKDILAQVGLEGYKHRYPNELSGGEKQRVAIARALTKDPQVILADEPTGNLDSETGKIILDTLKNISESRLVIMVTHDEEDAYQYGDRIIKIEDGKIISDEIKKENDAKSEETVSFKKSYFSYKYILGMAKDNLLHRKLRLFLTLFLFVFSLIFVGVCSNFTFYSSEKAAYHTFKKAGLEEIPLLKDKETRNIGYRLSFTDDDYHDLKTTYKNIQFSMIYDMRGMGLTLSNLVSDYHHNENQDDFNYVTIYEDDMKIPLVVGNYPKDNEILLTDYMADQMLDQHVFQYVQSYGALIGKTFSYQQHPLQISGIVDTNYQHLDKEQVSYGLYDRMYMNQETYDRLFNFFNIYFYTSSNNDGEWSVSGYHTDFKDLLIGDSRLPIESDEIVLSFSKLESIFQDAEISEVSEYLNQEIRVSYFSTKEEKDVMKTYKIVGVLNDSNQDIYYDMMLSQKEFDELKSVSSDAPCMLLLINLPSASAYNHLFQKANLNKEFSIDHQTYYSNTIYSIDNNIRLIIKAIYFFGIIFFVLAAVLIFAFISISIIDRQKEIGTLRALGASGRDITKIFLTEGLILGFISSFTADILIIFFIKILNYSIVNMYQLKVDLLYISIMNLFFVFLLSLIVVTLAVYFHTRRIIKMNPIDAIKHIK